MRKSNLLIAFVFISFCGFSQTKEYTLRVNSGLFTYVGSGAERAEMMNYNLDRQDGYMNGPYGNKFGPCYGLSFNSTKINQAGMRFAIGLGYEMLRSKILIDKISLYSYSQSINETVDASGRMYLKNSMINLFPSLGYRIVDGNVKVDFDFGLDIAYIISSKEDGKAKYDGQTYRTTRDRKNVPVDARLRGQLQVSKGQYGAYVGFAQGFVNYQGGMVGGPSYIALSRMIRFGMTYRLKFKE